MRAVSPRFHRMRVDSPVVRLGPRHRCTFPHGMLSLRIRGAVAQLVAHLHGMEGVRGSSPLSSTIFRWGAAMDEHSTFSPRHVLIVGAGPGIGTSFARVALGFGAQVTLSARSASKLEQLTSELAGEGPVIDSVVADAADPEALRESISNYAMTCNVPIDCALFNVSTWVPGGLDSDLDGITDGLKAGVVSALAMAQAVIPRMRELSSSRIFFTGGGTADSPMTASFGLGLQKSALRNLAVALDKDLAETSIRVRTLTIRGSIAPGTDFDPDLIAKALWSSADERGVEKEFTGAGN